VANIGIKISKEGYPVKTCDDDKLVMSSKFNLLKTTKTGTVNASGIQTVAHGLGYKPIFMVTRKIGTGEYSLAGSVHNQAGVDSTNLNLGSSWGTTTMRYYIFYQELI